MSNNAEEKLEFVLEEIRAAIMEFEYYVEYDSASAFRRGMKILTQLVYDGDDTEVSVSEVK